MTAKQVLQVSDDARVRFAVRLANAGDVPTLARRGQDSLWQAERRFHGLRPSPLGVLPGVQMGLAASLRETQVGELAQKQQIARELLGQKANGEEVSATFEGRITIQGGRQSFKGLPVEVFRISLAFSLAESVGATIRKCPECGRFFLRVRRQIYCRGECTDRATWRNYPDHKKKKARKKQYEKHGWTLGARKQARGKR